MQETKRLTFYPWVRKIPWRRRAWQPTPVFLLENPMGRWAWWDTTHGVAKNQIWLKRLSAPAHSHTHTHTHTTHTHTMPWKEQIHLLVDKQDDSSWIQNPRKPMSPSPTVAWCLHITNSINPFQGRGKKKKKLSWRYQFEKLKGFMGQIPYKQKNTCCANLLFFFSEFWTFCVCSEISIL